MILRATGSDECNSAGLYPNVREGVECVAFVTDCVASSREKGVWKRTMPLGDKE